MSDELANFTGENQEGNTPDQNNNPDTAGAGKGKGKGKKGKANNAEGGEGKTEKAKKEPKPKRDNIAFINDLKSIASVRKAVQIAIAKKAKSAGREEAQARYDKEIEAGKAKLAEMIAAANAEPNLVQALIAMGEEPNKVITHYIDKKEKDFEAILTEKGYKVSRATLKNISIDIPESFLMELPLDLHEEVANRHKKNDFRLQAVCKKFNFLADVESGKIVNKDGKWVVPGPETAPAENNGEQNPA
jgi:hypothetical protein